MDTTNILTPEQLRSKDFFARLEVTRAANDAEIRAAYEQVRQRYLDFIEQYPDYSECYVLIEEAYRKLKDPEVRRSLLAAEQELEAKNKRAKLRTSILKLLLFIGANAVLFAVVYYVPPGGMLIKVGIGCAVIGLIAVIRLSRNEGQKHALFAFGLTVALCAQSVVGYRFFQRQRVYIDNQNAYDVMIKADGEEIATLYANVFTQRAMRPGTHTLEAYKIPGDSLLETFEVKVESGDMWLYNVMSAGEYTTGTESYSDRPYYQYLSGLYVPEYPVVTLHHRWINLDYDYVFESPPSEIVMQKGWFGDEATATKTYILRKGGTSISF